MNRQMTANDNSVPQYACLDAPYLKCSGPALPKLFEDVTLPCAMDLGSADVGEGCEVKANDDSTSAVEPNVNIEQVGTFYEPVDAVVGESSNDANNNNLQQNTASAQTEDTAAKQSNQALAIKLEDGKAKEQQPTFHKLEPQTIQQPRKFVPKQELHEYYTKLGLASQISHLKNYYVVWSFCFPKEVRYTCIFVCPLTLEGFSCGHVPEKSGGVIVYQSVFWYREYSSTIQLYELNKCGY